MRRLAIFKAGLIAGLLFAAAPAALADTFSDRPPAARRSRARRCPTTGPTRPAPSSSTPASGGSISSCRIVRRSNTASASAGPASPGRGVTHIANKREWPDWTPPAQMLKRRPDLPRHMEGGIDNPLGARAHVSRRHALPHPRLQRARHDRPGRLLRLHPHDQRRRERSLRARARSAPRSSCMR